MIKNPKQVWHVWLQAILHGKWSHQIPALYNVILTRWNCIPNSKWKCPEIDIKSVLLMESILVIILQVVQKHLKPALNSYFWTNDLDRN